MFRSHSASFFALLLLLCFCQEQSCLVESCRVSDLIPAQSPSCWRPVVRLPPGVVLWTVLPSVEVAARHSGRDRTPSRSSQVCFYVPVFLNVFPVSILRMPNPASEQQTAWVHFWIRIICFELAFCLWIPFVTWQRLMKYWNFYIFSVGKMENAYLMTLMTLRHHNQYKCITWAN